MMPALEPRVRDCRRLVYTTQGSVNIGTCTAPIRFCEAKTMRESHPTREWVDLSHLSTTRYLTVYLLLCIRSPQTWQRLYLKHEAEVHCQRTAT